MTSKSFLLLSFLLASLFLAATARDLAEKTEEKSTKEGGVQDQKFFWPYWHPYPWPYGYCKFGCCGYGYYGGCVYCCPYPGAEKEVEPGN